MAWPATVTDVERGVNAVFATTVKVTVPLPLPEEPDAMLSQVLCSDDDHVQPTGEVTARDAEPPARATNSDPGDTEYVHGTPAWTTLTVCPPMVTVPLR